MTAPTRERFLGSFIGQCLGDALGFPVEGFPPDDCREYIDHILEKDSIRMQAREPYAIGQYTDDSELARELIRSIVDKGRFSPIDFARRIAAIFRDEKIVGRGQTTTKAAFRLIEGESWEHSGVPSPAAGNGSAMRAAPIGLMFWNDPDAMLKAARDQSRITHADSRCIAGSIAIAGAAALAVQSDTIDPYAFLEQLSEWVEDENDAFAVFLQQLCEWIDLDIDEAVPLIARAGVGSEIDEKCKWISPFVVPSVLWSLYAFLKSPHDYRQSIRTAICAGGDVDTTAAMTGAVSGAFLGLDAIPSTAAQEVQDQGEWGYGELTALAGKFYEIAQGET